LLSDVEEGNKLMTEPNGNPGFDHLPTVESIHLRFLRKNELTDLR